MREIILGGRAAAGRVALVDDTQYERVAAYRWVAAERGRGYLLRVTYALTTQTPSPVYMHHLITGWPRVEHQDHDGLNNQRFNLRPCNQTQNNANARLRFNNTSGFKGVSWDSTRHAWRAYIVIHGRQRHLGRFAEAGDAALAYDLAARDLFGEFAWVNFPD